jgi:hypothetical protein
MPCLMGKMKTLLLIFALGTMAAAPQESKAAGTAVRSNYNWDDDYWHTHKYGYWHGQKGYWRVKNGKHFYVVVQ